MLPRLIAGLMLTGAASTAEAIGGADIEALMLSYLAKFPQFVEWPEAQLPPPGGAFNFCVLGDEDLTAIAATVGQQKAQQRPFNVVDGKRRGSLTDCHILYLGHSEGWRVKTMLASVQSHPVLTISDIDGFAGQGGIIDFVVQDHHLKFEINLKAAAKAGLHINAQLASLAVKVY
jgi:hypothetical protein